MKQFVSSAFSSEDMSREENKPLETSERGTFCSGNTYYRFPVGSISIISQLLQQITSTRPARARLTKAGVVVVEAQAPPGGQFEPELIAELIAAVSSVDPSPLAP
jgi:hypothetical protein